MTQPDDPMADCGRELGRAIRGVAMGATAHMRSRAERSRRGTSALVIEQRGRATDAALKTSRLAEIH